MRTIVLIGGMGSGKSTVSRMLEKRGARCIDLDGLGHCVLADPAVAQRLVDEFGEQILSEGAIDRKALAKAAFETPESANRLSAITHPAIVRLAQSRLAEAREEGCCLAVLEISAFKGMTGPFEALLDDCCGIVAVVASEEVRVARAVSRGFSEDDVRARIANQPTDEQRAVWASDLVENNGSLEDLDARVGLLWQKYFV